MATTFPRETTEPQLEVTLEVGTHVLELVVEDSAGNLSEPDTVTITVVGLPTITSASPNTGVAGSQIAINGRNFLDVTSVSFGGVDTEATVESKTRIIATVPVEAPLGAVDIIVTTAYGQAISPEPFVVEMPLTMAGIAPGSALLGSAITATISGTGLA
ncbi:MAG: IPT/TIG domain-containing protein, partial [Gammaproteobacteria bacterium]